MTLRVLSIQSHVVHGYVGNRSAVFPLQVLGIEVDYINSVQFSNHTGYPSFKGPILNARELLELYSGLKANGLSNYSHILTGYVGSVEFLEAVAEIIKDIKLTNPLVKYYCDPVLGDAGEFYVPTDLIPIYREKILPLADVILPNQFEAEILTTSKITDEASALACIDLLHRRYHVSTVVISSTNIRPSPQSRSVPADYMLGYASRSPRAYRGLSGDFGADPEAPSPEVRNGSTESCERVRLVIPLLKHEFRGTGDLFSALSLARLEGKCKAAVPSLQSAFQHVLSTMQAVLRRTMAMANSVTAPTDSRNRDWASLELKLVQSVDDIRDPPVRTSENYVECIESFGDLGRNFD